MNQVYEKDILNAGEDQVIIDNGAVKVVIVPKLGGRIADILSDDEVKFIHRTYPKGVNFGPYTEYGGIEECIGGAPGSLWNARWKYEQEDDSVLLRIVSRNILVHKLITLDESEPIVKVEYSFFNLSDNFSKFTFGIHPEVCIGESLRDNRYHVPAGDGLLSGEYTEPGFKDKVPPSEGWCAVTCDEKAFGQMFPNGVIDVVEIYYPMINTHTVLEPMIFGVGISPGMCAGFTYMIYAGDGDAETVREVRSAHEAELSAKYEPFDRAEIPEELIAELEDRAEQKVGVGEERVFPGVPKSIQIPDVGAIIERALSKVHSVINAKTGFKPSQTAEPEGAGRTEELQPGVEIAIRHLRGRVTVQGWERPYIEYSSARGGVIRSSVGKFKNAARLETSEDCLLKVPRWASWIIINFVDGDVSISDIASSLKVSGVTGGVKIAIAEVPDGGTVDVSMVSGDIDLSVPGDSSCRISAATVNGDIAVGEELNLREVTSSRNRFAGVMNDGTAKIVLHTVNGDISVNRSARGESDEQSAGDRTETGS